MKLIHVIRKFIREHHPDKQWRKLSPQKIFESPSLSQAIKKRYVPIWFKAFSDSNHGGFYERLDLSLNPIKTGTKRLLSQCRQLYLYTETDAKEFLPRLGPHYQFIIDHYAKGDGRWIYSIDDDHKQKDRQYDFYSIAFLILSFTIYGTKSNHKDALRLAKESFKFIQTNMKHNSGNGYVEQLDDNNMAPILIRRQNPHMHFFEACLFAYESTKDPDYIEEAHYLFYLFETYFFDKQTNTLREFFDEDLNVHPEQGHIVEAGHHFEWVWLLDFYIKLCPQKKNIVEPYINSLYDFACKYGYDSIHGGIFDEIKFDGTIIKDTKRIWPLCEAIRAHRIMRDRDLRAVPLLESTKTLLNTRYLRANGAWIERWSRDFQTIETNYCPATSVYHL
jgi:mannose/cellobiose epimerase-like protein (N-acyl-D-glucosamine 2-epimerase family)